MPQPQVGRSFGRWVLGFLNSARGAAFITASWSLSDRRPDIVALTIWGMLAGLALFLARAPLSLALMGVSGAAVTLLTLIRPALGLAFLALVVPFGPSYELPLGFAGLGATEIVAILTLSAWIGSMLARGRLWVRGSRLWVSLVALLSILLISLTGALSLGYAVKEIAKWLAFAGIIACAASETNAAERRIIFGAMLAAGTLAGLQGWAQFLGGKGPEGFLLFGRFMRAYGSFMQPNPYAGYLGLILPFAVALLISYWPWSRGRKDDGENRRGDRAIWALALIAVLSTAPALLMTWSRGAWLGVGAACLLVILLRGRRFAALAIIVALALAGLSIITGADRYVPAAISGRLLDIGSYIRVQDVSDVVPNTSNWAVVERLAHWQAATRMAEAHPLLGVGIGNYEPVYPSYRLPRWPDPLGHAHNVYLNILAEAGLLGFAAFTLFWAVAISLPLTALRRCAGIWRGAALGVAGALVHLSVHNAFDNLFVQGIYLQVAIMLGLTIPSLEMTRREKPLRN